MRHGDELEVLHEGIRVFPKSVEPLGIEDGTRCWGLWVRSQRKKMSHSPSTQHLVISPIHPDYWTSVFHLKLKLADELGSLDKATGLLSDLGVNILFSDCAPSGYRQATFTAICENEGIRNIAKNILKIENGGFSPSSLFKDAESVTGGDFLERQFQEIGAALLVNLAVIYAKIRIAENELFEAWRSGSASERPFLHYRAIETGPQPWYVPLAAIESIADAIAAEQEIPIWAGRVPSMSSPEIRKVFEKFRAVATTRIHSLEGGAKLLTQEALEALAAGSGVGDFIQANLRSLWRSQRVEPVSLRGLLTLAYQRVWSDLPQIEFSYNKRAALLEFDNNSRDDFFNKLDTTSADAKLWPPSPAIASLHRHDRFIRLRFLEHKVGSRLISVGLKFHSPRAVAAGPSPSPNCSVTKGLLHAVVHTLAVKEVNLLRLRSQALDFDAEFENGTFQMVGLLPGEGDLLQQSLELEKLVRQEVGSFNDRIELRDLKIRPLLRRQLFLSMPQNATRRENIIEIVEEVAALYGFQVTQAMTGHENVTDEVLVKIKSATAMLQIIVLPESSKHKYKSAIPDFQWLWAEYGMALIRPLPTKRIKDDNIPDSALEHVNPRLNQDKPIGRFSTNSDLRKTLRPQIEEFLRTITDETWP